MGVCILLFLTVVVSPVLALPAMDQQKEILHPGEFRRNPLSSFSVRRRRPLLAGPTRCATICV